MALLREWIRSANFKQASSTDSNDMSCKRNDVLQKIKEENKLQLCDIKSAIDDLREAICHENYPTDKDHCSHGTSMAMDTLDAIQDLMKYGVSARGFSQGECLDLLLNLTCSSISCGLGPVHLEMIKKIRQFDGFSDFVEQMDATCVKRLTDALTIRYRVPADDGGMKVSEYSSKLSSLDALLHLLVKNIATGEKHVLLMSLYSHFLEEESRLEEPLSKNMNVFVETLSNNYPDKAIYNGITDLEMLKSQLCRVRRCVLDASFPRTEKFDRHFANDVQKLMKAILSSGLIEELAEEVLTILVELCRSKDAQKYECVVDRGFRYFFDKFPIKKPNEKLFHIIIESVTTVCEVCNYCEMLDMLVRYAMETLMAITEMKPCGKSWLCLTIALLKTKNVRLVSEASNPVMETKMKKVFDLANNQEEIPKIMLIISGVDIPVLDFSEEEADKKDKDLVEAYADFIDYFLRMVKNSKMLKAIVEPMVDYILDCWDKRSDLQFLICEKCCERDYLKLQTHPHIVNRILKKILVLLKDETYHWKHNNAKWIYPVVVEASVHAFKDGKQISEEDNKLFLTILEELSTREFIDEDDGYSTVFLAMFHSLLNQLVNLHRDSDTMDSLCPIIPLLLKLSSHEEEQVSCSVSAAMNWLSTKSNLLAPYMNELIDAYMVAENSSLAVSIFSLYSKNPKPLHDRFQELFDFVHNGDATLKSTFLAVFQEVAKREAKLFTDAMLKTLVEEDMNDVSGQTSTIMILYCVSEVCPQKVEIYFELLLGLTKCTMAYYVLKILAHIANSNEKYAKTTIDTLMLIAQGNDETSVTSALGGIRSMIHKYLDLIKPHKENIEKIQKATMSGYGKDACVGLIDIIEGRSLAGVHDDVKQQQDEIDDLGERVDDTEVAVAGLTNQVDKHEEDIGGVKRDVAAVEERVEVVEEDLEEAKVKVEEIDNKTMTNAPAWSRDLTKIMNTEDDHDWRLLAQRLGYSPDDIRHWATQSDPCMSLLSEWYATHKTSEATHAILKELVEMDRMDGAAIVENAMKAVEGVVKDEAPEYETPPPIFLSYQWGHQNEVKMLRKHLLMAGYDCWMDIGQMGGGDKLFEKIDDGIRAAKVVIGCVTEKYAKSPNCNREVNLSVTLGKPMIPLLMEKMGWPPRGAMGPIFSEYLFIRFFQRSDKMKDERFWSTEKFQELLMQLNFLGIMPEADKIDTMYKNWWEPVTEEIIVDKNRNQKKTTTGAETMTADDKIQTEGAPPSVFISYQWGKQKQIIALYKRLMGLGYHCWMDIHQMGGGDSLYDKIDQGVRGSKVVLSCVTQKYALSANCRREVSLADALKKPIVPLLLESTDWPPPGPMSMVFTQLLYIDFQSDPNIQTTWNGPNFNELLAKLNQFVADLHPSEKGVLRKEGSVKSIKDKGPVTTAVAISSITKSLRNTEQGVIPKSEAQQGDGTDDRFVVNADKDKYKIVKDRSSVHTADLTISSSTILEKPKAKGQTVTSDTPQVNGADDRLGDDVTAAHSHPTVATTPIGVKPVTAEQSKSNCCCLL